MTAPDNQSYTERMNTQLLIRVTPAMREEIEALRVALVAGQSLSLSTVARMLIREALDAREGR